MGEIQGGLIRSLDDVESYSRRHAQNVPQLAHQIEFRRPGLNDLEIARLCRFLPRLTDDYLDILRTWDLADVSIGYFDLRPPSYTQLPGMVDRLIGANTNSNPGFATMVR